MGEFLLKWANTYATDTVKTTTTTELFYYAGKFGVKRIQAKTQIGLRQIVGGKDVNLQII